MQLVQNAIHYIRPLQKIDKKENWNVVYHMKAL